MTPVFGLHLAVWMCVLVVILGFALICWAVAPHKSWMRNLRFSLLLFVSLLGLLAFWSVFLRLPVAITAIVMMVSGVQVQNLGYWISLPIVLLADVILTTACFYEAATEAWELLHRDTSQMI